MPMSKDELDPRKAIGCMIVVLRFVITIPLWYFLIYSILEAVDATTPMWTAFWVYMPTGILFSLAQEFVDQAFKD